MPLPLIPLPHLVEPGGDPFRLLAGARLAGVPEVVAALLRERTGLSLDGCGAGLLEFRLAAGGAPESYRLEVDATGVRVVAADEAGLFYAGCTLEQLLAEDPEGWILPAVVIEDAPRFGYRGAMLDVARHFFDVTTVKRFIDQLARLKLNVLHLHLTDDHGWRIEIASRPHLTARGSGSEAGGGAGGYFTQADYVEIVGYAAGRCVTIVPEIDLPGHTHAIGLAYPDLAEQPVLDAYLRAQIEALDGVLPVAGEPFTGLGVGFSSLRIGHEPSYDFVADVLGELAGITPGPYLHIGGDECLGTPPAAFADFLRRVTAMVERLGKTPIAWHEAGAAPGLAPGTVGQYWGFLSPDELAAGCAQRLVAAGSRLVLSPSDAAYLDMRHPEDPSGQDWANGPTSLRRSYCWEPSELIPGVGETDILGIEAPLWTEFVRTPAQVDALVFPRLAAIAEIAWSAPAGAPGRNWSEFRQRVAGLAASWRAQGIGFTAVREVEWP
ncbi:MAG: beta-N-acetylhexosaminidase [Actinobacteria bacterium]|nr:beta-N-acetylhexosaminidase [Actinomycetota bacterium]